MKEMTLSESKAYQRELLSKPKKLRRGNFIPGNLIYCSYNAQDQEQTFDRTPLVLILGVSGRYVLGLNFHWLPYQKRIWLINRILESSQAQIKKHNRIRFTYEDFKPLMKSVQYQPCIRLYIKRRIGSRGVLIAPSELMSVARLKAETFTQGKYSQSQLYRMAKQRGKR